MGRKLTQREIALRDAYETLKRERAELRIVRARVEAARQAVEAFNRCDECGQRTLSAGLEPTLCTSCAMARREAERIAVLAAHGYDAKGRKVRPAAA